MSDDGVSARLTRYEAARFALEAASSFDEVKDVRDRWVALQTYARQAKDFDLIDRATDIRLRAERRAGEMLVDMRECGERAKGGESVRPQPTPESPPVTLADLGITKMQSHRWQGLARLDEVEFEKRVAVAKREALSSIVSTREERKVEKQLKRAGREAELARMQLAAPDKTYGVLYVDPPWAWEAYNTLTAMVMPDDHFATMSIDEIKAFDLSSKVAARDSALFLWTTVPLFDVGVEVLKGWGFTYKSCATWEKAGAPGTGYWFRNNTEHLLVGTRGDIPCPAPGTQWPSLIKAPVGRYGEKPAIFYEMIESYFPNLPKIEFFARLDQRRRGWDHWGAEAPADGLA